MKQLDERRLAENEVIFKQINEDVGDFLHDIGVQHVVAAPFYCECSNIHCTQRIELSGAEYKSIHRNPKRFIVINGHENHDIEKTVERRVTYSIVEKMKDLPRSDEVAHRLKELK